MKWALILARVGQALLLAIGYNCRTHMGEYVTMQMYKIYKLV